MPVNNLFKPNDPASIALNAQSAVGAGTPIQVAETLNTTFSIGYDGAVASGVVVIEWFPVSDYAGLWHQIASVNVATITSDGTIASQTFASPPGYVRPRISTVIGGGTVTVRLNAQLDDTVVRGQL